MSNERYQVCFLPPRICIGDRDADATPRELELLLYLAFRDRPVSKDELAEAYAPERSSEDADRAIRVVVTRIRKKYGEDTIVSTRGAYQLGPNVDVPFRALLQRVQECAAQPPTPAQLSALRQDLADIDAALGLPRPPYEWGEEFDAMLMRTQERIRAILARPAQRTNLPSEVSAFVGRTDDLNALEDLVRRERLVTLIGPGGMGKTRTATHVAGTLADMFHDGAWFVDLSPLRTSQHLVSAVAQVVGVDLPPEADAAQHLARALESRRMLIVLDNCEHVVRAAASLADQLLRECAGVRVLATSRQRLGIAGEHVFSLLPLDDDAAVELFATRARAADHRFCLTPDNRDVVADLCRRLDGMPFAIELAAALAASLGVREVARQLHNRMRVLQPISTLLDWSYDLLDAGERIVFRRWRSSLPRLRSSAPFGSLLMKR